MLEPSPVFVLGTDWGHVALINIAAWLRLAPETAGRGASLEWRSDEPLQSRRDCLLAPCVPCKSRHLALGEAPATLPLAHGHTRDPALTSFRQHTHAEDALGAECTGFTRAGVRPLAPAHPGGRSAPPPFVQVLFPGQIKVVAVSEFPRVMLLLRDRPDSASFLTSLVSRFIFHSFLYCVFSVHSALFWMGSVSYPAYSFAGAPSLRVSSAQPCRLPLLQP